MSQASDSVGVVFIKSPQSEAWDIVQMEEIERELLDSDDMDFSLPEAED